jgi:GNAT superfamily N-acetyltransferase
MTAPSPARAGPSTGSIVPRFLPVTGATAGDLERFSASYGTFRWCSCMRWRLRSTPFRDSGKEGRAAALAKRVRAGEPVGVLAYADAADAADAEGAAEAAEAEGEPVGWCSIAPRESYAAIGASRVIPHLPGTSVWSVTCFFVASRARHQGLREGLLDAACAYAADAGARILEAYPSPNGKAYRYMGTRELYLAAGFRDVEAAEGTRPVMRKVLLPSRRPEPRKNQAPPAVRTSRGRY